MLFTCPVHAVFYGLATVYIVSFVLIHRLSDTTCAPSLYSDWLCWSLLFVVAKVTGRNRHVIQNDGQDSPDKLAMAVVAASVCWSLGDAHWAVPLTTPFCLLIVFLKAPRPKLPVCAPEKPNGFHKHTTSVVGLPIKGLAMTVVIAAASTASLFPSSPLIVDVGGGIAFASCLLIVYVILYQGKQEDAMDEPWTAIRLPASNTAWRVIALLTMMVLLPSTRVSHVNLVLVVLVAVLKAFQWVSILALVHQGFLLPMSTLATFTISIIQLAELNGPSGRTKILASVALVSLGQTYRFIQKLAYSRQILIAFTCLLITTLIARHPIPEDWRQSWKAVAVEPHPIEVLARDARQQFNDMLNGQSKTVEAAIAEYERRYRRVPPPGFDRWVTLALEADCPIIDNFDTVMQSLEPFWGMTAQEMRARSTMMRQDPMAVVDISNHSVSMPKDSLVLGHFNEIISEWTNRHRDMLPDMSFLINGLAEPRVIVPNDHINHLVHTCAPAVNGLVNGTRKPLEIMDLGKLSSWQIGTRSCPESSPSRAIIIPADKPGLEFLQNVTAAKDWCENPAAVHTHGLFSSPYNLKITDTLVPIFSHGKPSTSQDILYPSPDYLYSYRSQQYDPNADIPWANKTNKMYWAGSDTGGFARGMEWRNFHRQRFVGLFSNDDKEATFLRRNGTGKWETYDAKMDKMNALADVKLTALDACSGMACVEEEKFLRVGDRDEPSKIYEYRYLFDVDGMGRTERYYRLLGMRSTVLKQTMHREWHDDRLIPWVHYVPISLSLEELPETLNFLTQTDAGQEISEYIANAGRDWQQKALRDKDMELAFLRILLEYGRLYGEERDMTAYCPDGRVRPD